MQHIHGPNCGCSDYMGIQNTDDLLGSIDVEKVRCLNEKHQNTGKKVLKEYENRYDKQNFVQSESDGQFLLIIPFTSQVKIRSICVIAQDENHSPTHLRIYINNENVDFSLTENTPIQQFILAPNLDGANHNAVKPSKFTRVQKLILHLKSEQVEEIGVSYIQIKGESTNIKRKAVNAVYEVQPNAKKTQMKDLEKNPFQM